jgi:glycosyltransferase involved in cell wall biosynthesis
MIGTSFFEKMFSKKAPIIFDFDDSIWIQNVSEMNKRFSFLKNAEKTKDLIKLSSMIFAGNQYLANYASGLNKNIKIVPTTIDTDQYKRVDSLKKEDRVCIGWSGSFSTIQHFKTAIPFLTLIKKKYGEKVYFKIIGDGKYYSEELDTKGIDWNAKSEIEDLSEFDIGIMPLPDDDWAKGKCGLKGLQFMALHIPTLMSPVGVNVEIIQQGINGFLPKSLEDWVEQLSKLIEDKNLRDSIGHAGRKTVEDNYSVKAWKDRYLEYFNEACEMKRK